MKNHPQGKQVLGRPRQRLHFRDEQGLFTYSNGQKVYLTPAEADAWQKQKEEARKFLFTCFNCRKLFDIRGAHATSCPHCFTDNREEVALEQEERTLLGKEVHSAFNDQMRK